MKHILGMAKSNLDLRGAKSAKLELDVLRLIYAVQHLRVRDGAAHGFMLVLDAQSARRVNSWLRKYSAVDCVSCSAHSPVKVELLTLRAEKQANTLGMIAGSQGVPVDGRSSAKNGERIGESALSAWILRVETGVRRKFEGFPFDVRWDFYGVSE